MTLKEKHHQIFIIIIIVCDIIIKIQEEFKQNNLSGNWLLALLWHYSILKRLLIGKIGSDKNIFEKKTISIIIYEKERKQMCKMFNCRQCCSQWRLWIRPIAMGVYVLFVVIVLPWLIFNSVKDGFSRKEQLTLISGLFVLTAIPISIWHITQHIFHYTRPILQKHIIRILWMVPIYALNAVNERKNLFLLKQIKTFSIFIVARFAVPTSHHLHGQCTWMLRSLCHL